jgi:hypothetical protein
MSRRCTLVAEIEHLYPGKDGHEAVAYPQIRIKYSYTAGCAPRIRWDENDHPGWSPEVELIDAVLLKDAGLHITQAMVVHWARQYLESDTGYLHAVENAAEKEFA